MSRPVRIEFPGACYHITSKAAEGRTVFRDKQDRVVFLNVLESVVDRFGWLLHSYVLMEDHYHLVVEIPEVSLSKGMRQLNGVYTQHVNRRHLEEGPIFQGRFKSVIFEKSDYLLPVCRHVALNPVRNAGIGALKNYRWSSHRAIKGDVRVPKFLHCESVLSSFGKREKDNQRKYSEYVRDGVNLESPLNQRSNQVLLGSARFRNQLQPMLNGEKLAKRGPKRAKRRRSLNMLFKNSDLANKNARNELIRKAHMEHAYTLMEIGSHLGLHYTTVSKVINGK